MPNYKAAFEAASSDLSTIMSLLGFTSYPGIDPMMRAITNLTLAKEESQALREYLQEEREISSSLLGKYDALEVERDEYEALCNRQAELLSQAIVAIRGPEPELTRWGYADLPLRVKTLADELAHINSLANCGTVQNWLKLSDEDKAKWFALYCQHDDENVEMRRELDELRKDKARLDRLDQLNAALNTKYGTTYRWQVVVNHNVNRLMLGHLKIDLNDQDCNGLPSCRDALDTIMPPQQLDGRGEPAP